MKSHWPLRLGLALACLVLHGLVLAWLASLQSPAPVSHAQAKPRAVDIQLLKTSPQPPSERAPAATAQGETRPLATQAAPAPPSAQDWAFAAQYTLKNSKAYRHQWGLQVRSMMGTATEGPQQGLVRFRIEIAPDGQLSQLVTLWSTSDVAEKKAREAIARLPALPPTPTGLPLIFERTIAFSPFAHDDPPVYRYDCDPETATFRNAFVWDGQSAQMRQTPTAPAPKTAQEMEDCRKQLPQETIDAEVARDRRVMERWGWSQR